MYIYLWFVFAHIACKVESVKQYHARYSKS